MIGLTSSFLGVLVHVAELLIALKLIRAAEIVRNIVIHYIILDHDDSTNLSIFGLEEW